METIPTSWHGIRAFFEALWCTQTFGTKNAQRAARVLVDILMEVGIDAEIGWPIKELGERHIGSSGAKTDPTGNQNRT